MSETPSTSNDQLARERQVRLARSGRMALLAEVTRLSHQGHGGAGEALTALLALLHSELGLERSAVGLLGPSRHVLVIDCARGLSLDERARLRYSRGEGALGRVLLGEGPLVLPVVRDPGDPPGPDHVAHDERALLCVCVPGPQGQVLGTLSGEVGAHDEAQRALTLQTLQLVGALITPLLIERLGELDSFEAAHARGAERTASTPGAELSVGASSPGMREVARLLRQAAPSEVNVLIRGESGVGKELISRALHAESRRKQGACIVIRCASLGETTIEAEIAEELTRAAADVQEPLTLFLDEVSELTSSAQAQVLRLLQDGESRRDARLTRRSSLSSARVLSASREDLAVAVAEGRFRADLYYRLQVFTIDVPALRERRSDIPQLAQHFVEKFAARHERHVTRLSESCLELLLRHGWPGNVRELENCMSRAVLLAHDGVVRQHHLPRALQPHSPDARAPRSLPSLLREQEREIVQHTLSRARGDRKQAARALGTTPRALAYRMKQLDLHARRGARTGDIS